MRSSAKEKQEARKEKGTQDNKGALVFFVPFFFLLVGVRACLVPCL